MCMPKSKLNSPPYFFTYPSASTRSRMPSLSRATRPSADYNDIDLLGNRWLGGFGHDCIALLGETIKMDAAVDFTCYIPLPSLPRQGLNGSYRLADVINAAGLCHKRGWLTA